MEEVRGGTRSNGSSRASAELRQWVDPKAIPHQNSLTRHSNTTYTPTPYPPLSTTAAPGCS